MCYYSVVQEINMPTCPKRELRIGRKLKSDSEDAALDLPEWREDLLEDAGTGEDDVVDSGHISPLEDELGRVCLRESKNNAASSEPSVKDWVRLGIRGELQYLC